MLAIVIFLHIAMRTKVEFIDQDISAMSKFPRVLQDIILDYLPDRESRPWLTNRN